MALSYTGARNHYGSLTNDTASANLTLGDTLINEGVRVMLGDTPWPFLEATGTEATVASTQGYTLTGALDKVVSVKVTVGTYQYRPKEITSFRDWDFVNSPTGVTGDQATYYFIIGSTLNLWPTPATTGSTITFNYLKLVKDLSVADYTTGSVTTATLGSKAIVGSGTTWTAGMVGKFLRITSTSAANVGDGLWYEIAAVGSTTTITLTREYSGVSIAAGSAGYTIADLMVIPEKYHLGPVYYAASQYWMKEGDMTKADRFTGLFNETLERMRKEEGSKNTDVVVDDGNGGTFIINPNLDKAATGS